jgi:uncharacterized protein YdeI (YjbR/CyaY-like superfamily)
VRWIKFSDLPAIVTMEPVLKAYIREAIELEKAGLKVDFNKNRKLVFPEEFQIKLEENPAFKTAFEGLTPGRQRGYNLYFSAPKQSKTRESSIKKCMPQILKGNGLMTANFDKKISRAVDGERI